ncbi:uncharacterized protein LOC133841625 isoform X1 [Drosophila sulfurigaster albostrigata]|uniref:uncharacterized protein LOC133841625 isoform X1 n=1 Tax=Drosophila sulfurigaster albostrigata TaxID=89887 RepID=UPI002D2192B7|nr:uncharacterized protein LOC133841625 isoform X1 [Drosophila sulfurigaster albostrigata]
MKQLRPTNSVREREKLIMLFLYLAVSINASDNWQQLPTLDTFASYEDMQRYFDQRRLHSTRQIKNPTGDSYLAAFNQYNEQPENSNPATHLRTKREERQLPTAPRMLRFQLSDAVEPSNELKQLLRMYRDSAPIKATVASEVTKSPASPSSKNTKTAKSHRSRRSTVNQQPANFKVQMIPFEASDAREPDTITAKLISRARALDLQRQPVLVNQPIHKTTAKTPKVSDQSTRSRVRQNKRSKRSASLHVVKFELADAKSALPDSLQRSGKQLLTMETLAPVKYNRTEDVTNRAKSMDDNMVLSGETAAETKRMFVYKDAPHAKTKKSITLPHEVQKVITHLIKDGHGGKAYIKYLNPQNSNYEHLKAKTVSYVHKPAIKLVPAKSIEPVQVHIQPVPVVEELRYVYKPSFNKVYPITPTINQPIVVQETAAPVQNVEEIHHTYSAQLAPPQAIADEATAVVHPYVATSFAEPQFHPSKPDPLQTELTQPDTLYEHRPIEQYNYETQAAPQQLIKIEYHAPVDSINDHYKQMPEFRELSTLIGKSPDDQIHGLTYLLAKDMQAKLQRQPKLVKFQDRPQDSTAPILFHPQQIPSQSDKINTPSVPDHGTLGVQPGRLIGMAKTKQYVPIVEPGNNDVVELPVVPSSASPKVPTPSSYIDFQPGHGLSNGYDGAQDEQPLTTLKHIGHHSSVPTILKEETVFKNLHYAPIHNDKSLQYASKYAFGYRIRDFHTGNDFGHKQNRDSHGVTRGQYHILLPDGRIQNVIYHADDTGFHADVSFEGGKSRH